MSEDRSVSRVPIAASSYTPEVQQPGGGDSVSKPEVTLDKLAEVAGPLIQSYFESQERVHQRNLEFETTMLEHSSRRQRDVVWAVGMIIAVVLAFAAYLIAQGRDAVALDVIKLVASLGSVGFGGYGIAMARRRIDKRDE